MLDRLARVGASEEWAGGLNPTQAAALDYLSRANRFSRSPTQVSDYLSATRGTVSQTLKALARKGLIVERRSAADKRSISYDVTTAGPAALTQQDTLDTTLTSLSDREAKLFADALHKILKDVLDRRGGRQFGLCKTCKHHGRKGKSAHCLLLDTPLKPAEASQICYEHAT